MFAQGLAAGKTAPEAYRDAGFSTRTECWRRNAAKLACAAEIKVRVRN